MQGYYQRLRHGQLLPCHGIRHLHHMAQGMSKVPAHTALRLDSQNLQLFTAVGSSLGTGITGSAVEIRIQNDPVPLFDSVAVFVLHLHHNPGGFMSNHQRIRHIRAFPCVGMDIGAADSQRLYLDNSISFLPLCIRNLRHIDFSRFINFYCLHHFSFPQNGSSLSFRYIRASHAAVGRISSVHGKHGACDKR